MLQALYKNVFIYMAYFIYIFRFTAGFSYKIGNHPCCQEAGGNLTLAMVIDAYEIYGHDPTDKLDHMAHYQYEMMKIKHAPDQYLINERVHIATDHLGRFITLHVKELKVLLIALDDTIDNMLTMYENHNALKSDRITTYSAAQGGNIPSEFYISQEYYCGKNVYIFLSELYSDIYEMGRGPAPYCKGRSFHFLGFVHFLEENHYYLEEDPNVAFQMDNYIHGMECHLGVCVFRFPFKKSLQHLRDVATLPKAIVKCGLVMYKLPPLTAASCIITSGSFILDFNVQGIRFRHYDYMLTIPNGHTYYTKEPFSPLACDHHVCEWNYTNFYGGPFVIPGDPGGGLSPIPPWMEKATPSPMRDPGDGNDNTNPNVTYTLDGCWFMFPPNYGSIAGVSYLDPLSVNENRFTCQGTGSKGLYWYPQWMGAPPHHPYPHAGQLPDQMEHPPSGPYYPHKGLLPMPPLPKPKSKAQQHHGFSYKIGNHPCCQEAGGNLTLAMVIDAYEIYGHDPTDKLDHMAHYQYEMMKIKHAPDQYLINERVHIATDHLGRFITLHVKELKVLLIALDDTIDNMLTMYENHNALKSDRITTYSAAQGGNIPSEFYISQEYYCGKNVYIFLSELYSDIYEMGRGPAPYCKGRSFHFLGFVHFLEENHYYLEEDPNVAFQMDNYIHGMECHLGVCVFRFPFKKSLQHLRDVATLPKAIVKCGLVMYKLPPLTAASCIITSGSFILDFNVQGIRFRHYDYMLTIPNGHTYYTKEPFSPLACDHHVCEWNYTNFYGGPFVIPGDPGGGLSPIPPWMEKATPSPPMRDPGDGNDNNNPNITYTLDGCWFMFPPNYGSIAGVSYLDPLSVNENRFTCQGTGSKGLYWYPQWMGAPPHHPYPHAGQLPDQMEHPPSGPYYPHKGLLPMPPLPKPKSKAQQRHGRINAPTKNTPEESFSGSLDGCSFKLPPKYGSIGGISYQDPLSVNEKRFTCQGTGNKGLYWYPQWMGAPSHHPYPHAGQLEQPPAGAGPHYPHKGRRLFPTGHSGNVRRASRLIGAP